MKMKLFTFLSFIIILSSCSSSKQVMELNNSVKELEEILLYEREKNSFLASFRFSYDGNWCGRGMREVKPYSGTYDSLCIMYNNLIDKQNSLKEPSLVLEKDFNIHFAKSDSIILRLRKEYKSIKKSSK